MCATGEADVHYGHNTNPYLLSHVRPSTAAQQAAAQAAASLPPALRHIADFYSSIDADQRQQALGTLLELLQEPLQQQYASMWGPDAISVFVVKVIACNTCLHSIRCTGCTMLVCVWTVFCIIWLCNNLLVLKSFSQVPYRILEIEEPTVLLCCILYHRKCCLSGCLAVLQAAKSVSDGYHRNLSTALADMYQKHIGSFQAGLIHKLCGNSLDVITLWHMHQEWTASRPSDMTML